ERTRDAVPDRAGLAGEPAALHVRVDVVPADGLGRLERLPDHHLRRRAAEVIVQLALVDLDRPAARGEPDARDRRLAAPRRVESLRACHASRTPAQALYGSGCCAA